MKYFHKVQITKHREVYLNELTFDDYKNLQKICIEDDLELFHTYLKKLIGSLSVEPISDLNLIDMFLIALSIRSYSVDNAKVMYTYFDGNKHKLSLNVSSMANKVYSTYTNLQKDSVVDIDDFMIQQVYINPVDPENSIDYFILSNGDKLDYCYDIYENLPIKIKTSVDKHINKVGENYSNLELFRVTDDTDTTYVIKFDIEFENIMGIIRIIFRDDLTSLYKNIFDMKTKMNISLTEHNSMTYNEYMLYIKMFNKEQEELESQNKPTQDSGLPIPKS